MQCNVCSTPLTEILYASVAEQALTSLATLHEGKTEVCFCHQCGHVQSAQLENIDAFYDHEYDILVASEEEDQLYEVVQGAPVYRTAHQLRTLQRKLSLPAGAKVLDYGCAKSAMLRAMLVAGMVIEPYVFDVSDRYLPFWEKFLPAQHCATYVFPSQWNQQFDLVTSFFSLEHMPQPQHALQNIWQALRPGGKIYGIVPNLFGNTADLIVVDHVNHFTVSALTILLQKQGFEVIEIDPTAHRGAFVFIAQKTSVPPPHESLNIQSSWHGKIQELLAQAQTVAAFWTEAAARVRVFEAGLQSDQTLAIYGAGFYGAFLAAHLQRPEQLRYVVDQNPFLQGRQVHGVPVVAPQALPAAIDVLLVGLNPLYAAQQIAQIAAFSERKLNYFFL